jgi:hypothetical protein
MLYPFIKNLNNFREQVNAKPIYMGNSQKLSLHLVDTFFGFEVIILINQTCFINTNKKNIFFYLATTNITTKRSGN